jgi:hypothetical protein
LAAAVATALVLLLGLDVANPERIVVSHNARRPNASDEFDVDYAVGLSADAVPALASALSRLDEEDRDLARGKLCAFVLVPDDWPGFNLARARGRDVLEAFCSGAQEAETDS